MLQRRRVGDFLPAAAERARLQPEKSPPRSTMSVMPLPVGVWRTSNMPPRNEPVWVVVPTELVSVIAPARVSTTLPTGTEPPAVSGTKPPPGALTRTVPRVGATTTDSPCTGSGVVGVSTGGAGVPGSVGAGVAGAGAQARRARCRSS